MKKRDRELFNAVKCAFTRYDKLKMFDKYNYDVTMKINRSKLIN